MAGAHYAGRWHASQPEAIQEYRDRTHAENPSRFSDTFYCQTCRAKRPLAGRRQAVRGDRRSGFVCAECVAKREAV